MPGCLGCVTRIHGCLPFVTRADCFPCVTASMCPPPGDCTLCYLPFVIRKACHVQQSHWLFPMCTKTQVCVSGIMSAESLVVSHVHQDPGLCKRSGVSVKAGLGWSPLCIQDPRLSPLYEHDSWSPHCKQG